MYGKIFLNGCFRVLYDNMTEDLQQKWRFEEFEQLAKKEMAHFHGAIAETQKFNNKFYEVWTKKPMSRQVHIASDENGEIFQFRFVETPSGMKKTRNHYKPPVKLKWMLMSQAMLPTYMPGTLNFTKAANPQHPSILEQQDAFEAKIVAPADGRVVDVVSTIPNNKIGMRNENDRFGNYIVMAHERGEYSMLAHLSTDKIAVEKGQHVQTGDVIARAGNSGDSVFPHVHFRVMDQPDPLYAKPLTILMPKHQEFELPDNALIEFAGEMVDSMSQFAFIAVIRKLVRNLIDFS